MSNSAFMGKKHQATADQYYCGPIDMVDGPDLQRPPYTGEAGPADTKSSNEPK